MVGLTSPEIWIVELFDLEAPNLLHRFVDFVPLGARIAYASKFAESGKDCIFEVRDSFSEFSALETRVNQTELMTP